MGWLGWPIQAPCTCTSDLFFGLFGLIFGPFTMVEEKIFVSIFTLFKKTILRGKLFKGGNYSRAETSFFTGLKGGKLFKGGNYIRVLSCPQHGMMPKSSMM